MAALNATTPNGHLWHLYPNQKRARRMTPGVFQAIHGPEPVVVVSARWGAIISNIPRYSVVTGAPPAPRHCCHAGTPSY